MCEHHHGRGGEGLAASTVRGPCRRGALEAHRVPGLVDAVPGVEREADCLDASPVETEICADAVAGAQGVDREVDCLGGRHLAAVAAAETRVESLAASSAPTSCKPWRGQPTQVATLRGVEAMARGPELHAA